MSNAIDCATKLNSTHTANLVKQGITHVGRYLGNNWKSIEKAEVDAIKSSGLAIFSLFEKNSTNVSYFTYAQGKTDAIEATGYAEGLGQPHGTAIYFTVDFDAQPKDFGAILNYFKGVKDNLKSYVVGAYGSHSVLQFLQPQNVAKYFFQTVAWSGGLRNNFFHIYQYQCDKQLCGLGVDFVNLEQSDIGAWGKSKPYTVTIPNVAYWQAKSLVQEFQKRGYKSYGVALKSYAPNQQPSDKDPYHFVIETNHDEAVKLVIELKTRKYDQTVGTEIK